MRAGGEATVQTAILECSQPITWNLSSPAHIPHPTTTTEELCSNTALKWADRSGTAQAVLHIMDQQAFSDHGPEAFEISPGLEKAIPLNFDVISKLWLSLGICEDS